MIIHFRDGTTRDISRAEAEMLVELKAIYDSFNNQDITLMDLLSHLPSGKLEIMASKKDWAKEYEDKEQGNWHAQRSADLIQRAKELGLTDK